jgi:hypothetical protein
MCLQQCQERREVYPESDETAGFPNREKTWMSSVLMMAVGVDQRDEGGETKVGPEMMDDDVKKRVYSNHSCGKNLIINA